MIREEEASAFASSITENMNANAVYCEQTPSDVQKAASHPYPFTGGDQDDNPATYELADEALGECPDKDGDDIVSSVINFLDVTSEACQKALVKSFSSIPKFSHLHGKSSQGRKNQQQLEQSLVRIRIGRGHRDNPVHQNVDSGNFRGLLIHHPLQTAKEREKGYLDIKDDGHQKIVEPSLPEHCTSGASTQTMSQFHADLVWKPHTFSFVQYENQIKIRKNESSRLGGAWFIFDKGSSNGTFVRTAQSNHKSDVQLLPYTPYHLKNKDILTFGTMVESKGVKYKPIRVIVDIFHQYKHQNYTAVSPLIPKLESATHQNELDKEVRATVAHNTSESESEAESLGESSTWTSFATMTTSVSKPQRSRSSYGLTSTDLMIELSDDEDSDDDCMSFISDYSITIVSTNKTRDPRQSDYSDTENETLSMQQRKRGIPQSPASSLFEDHSDTDILADMGVQAIVDTSILSVKFSDAKSKTSEQHEDDSRKEDRHGGTNARYQLPSPVTPGPTRQSQSEEDFRGIDSDERAPIHVLKPRQIFWNSKTCTEGSNGTAELLAGTSGSSIAEDEDAVEDEISIEDATDSTIGTVFVDERGKPLVDKTQLTVLEDDTIDVADSSSSAQKIELPHLDQQSNGEEEAYVPISSLSLSSTLGEECTSWNIIGNEQTSCFLPSWRWIGNEKAGDEKTGKDPEHCPSPFLGSTCPAVSTYSEDSDMLGAEDYEAYEDERWDPSESIDINCLDHSEFEDADEDVEIDDLIVYDDSSEYSDVMRGWAAWANSQWKRSRQRLAYRHSLGDGQCSSTSCPVDVQNMKEDRPIRSRKRNFDEVDSLATTLPPCITVATSNVYVPSAPLPKRTRFAYTQIALSTIAGFVGGIVATIAGLGALDSMLPDDSL